MFLVTDGYPSDSERYVRAPQIGPADEAAAMEAEFPGWRIWRSQDIGDQDGELMATRQWTRRLHRPGRA